MTSLSSSFILFVEAHMNRVYIDLTLSSLGLLSMKTCSHVVKHFQLHDTFMVIGLVTSNRGCGVYYL